MEILNRDQQARRLTVRCRWWLVLLLLVVAIFVGADDGLPHWLTVISADQLRGDVGFLASKELSGRAVLSPGSRTAAAFIAARFQALGLKPAGEGDRDWFQEVPLARTPVRSGFCRLEQRHGDRPALELVWGTDFRCRPVDVRGIDVSAKAVFGGYGIHAPDLGHDDYAGFEVKNRVIIVLAGGPAAESDSEGERGLSSCRYRSVTAKRATARSRGAVALIVLPEPGTGEENARLRSDFWPDHLALAGEEKEDVSCPAILLEEDAARRLLFLTGIEAVPGGGPPRPLPGIRVSCSLEMEDTGPASTRNVLALIPGSDALRFREFIVVSAHYDHLGGRGDGRIFPGADDNASGVAAMLGAARALAGLPPHRRPARSILFAAWAGEERGFLGSNHFGRQPTVPRGQIKSMINLDMVGRNKDGEDAHRETALAIYSAQAPGFEALLDEAAETAGLDLRLRPRVRIGLSSDHMVFHRLGIPAVHLFSGLHEDYNRPGDTADKINYQKLLRVSRTAALLALQLADEPDPPAFDETINKVRGRIDPF